ncbi:transposase [Chromobacterium amazonense]|uniref:Transposase n=2 Tax=Chromobacterium amazonense TaxID=1382803 RepID=A0A2S9WZD7_9NEIS|nr:Rpn family recombination-promoting nuclease/putative transposase [Chromobacterium amazonense]PRP68831.1 transposase [Chromobacterium amazonense]
MSLSHHDIVFKQFLSEPATARDFLSIHLPPALRALCDLDTLRLESSSFVEPELRPYFSDVLYSLQMAGRPGYVLALVEHQSTPDKIMAFRLMRYGIAAMHQHLRNGHDRLPLVIPLLFYHGSPSPYPFSMNWLDLFDDPQAAAALYTQPFPLVDVTVIPDDEILQHKRVALLELVQKNIRQRDMMDFVQELAVLLQLGFCSDEQLTSLLHYMMQAGETAQPEVFLQTLAHSSPQYEELVMTIAQQLEERGRQEGMAVGVERGRQEGLQEGEKRGIVQVARQMLAKGMDRQAIQELTGLSEQELSQLEH